MNAAIALQLVAVLCLVLALVIGWRPGRFHAKFEIGYRASTEDEAADPDEDHLSK